MTFRAVRRGVCVHGGCACIRVLAHLVCVRLCVCVCACGYSCVATGRVGIRVYVLLLCSRNWASVSSIVMCTCVLETNRVHCSLRMCACCYTDGVRACVWCACGTIVFEPRVICACCTGDIRTCGVVCMCVCVCACACTGTRRRPGDAPGHRLQVARAHQHHDQDCGCRAHIHCAEGVEGGRGGGQVGEDLVGAAPRTTRRTREPERF